MSIQRYRINFEGLLRPDDTGEVCEYSDYESELEACCQLLIKAGISTGHASDFTDLIEECILNVVESPWVSVFTRFPTDHHPGYLARGVDNIPHKVFWNDDHWIYDGARFEKNAFIDWMEIPE